MRHPSNKYYLKLEDRVLLSDGDSIVPIDFLYKRILEGKSLDGVCLPDSLAKSEEVSFYNKKYPKEKVTQKNKVRKLSFSWDKMPEEYKNIDVDQYVIKKFKKEVKSTSFTKEQIKKRAYRLKMELRIWKERNLLDLLRTLIYIVNTFEEQNVVWGTGRGSSCASYVLYIIGLHQVDSVEYDLDITEFFR
jgi:DNA polymerase III alpha subunit